MRMGFAATRRQSNRTDIQSSTGALAMIQIRLLGPMQVVDDDGALEGIVTSTDLIRQLGELL